MGRFYLEAVPLSRRDSEITVDAKGRVTAVAQGTVTITVTDPTGKVTGTITFTVVPAAPSTRDGGAGGTGTGTGRRDGGVRNCTCYCGWPANQVCTSNTDCPPDTSVPGTYVPGVCGCPIGC
ncbi:MAG TPA: hypothetical protein VGJ84_03910 [Polyangiaceae bacterium]|jgi:hypothetical protein